LEGRRNCKTRFGRIVLHLDLYNVLVGKGSGCFSEQLFSLIMKADINNRHKLQQIYPDHFKVWEDYLKHDLDWLKYYYTKDKTK
jgi:hypothetical protein